MSATPPLKNISLHRPAMVDLVGRSIRLSDGGYGYWIDLHRINTPAKLAHWMIHLSGKTWEHADTPRALADVASRACGYVIPTSC